MSHAFDMTCYYTRHVHTILSY